MQTPLSSMCATSVQTHLGGCIQVACTGAEKRLSDCFFPQNLGIDYVFTPPVNDYAYYNENWPAPSHGLPNQAPVENAPPPSNGLFRAGCGRGDARRLSVICRRFEVSGAVFLILYNSLPYITR